MHTAETEYKLIQSLGIEPAPPAGISRFGKICLDRLKVQQLVDRFSSPANKLDLSLHDVSAAEWHIGVREALACRAHDYLNPKPPRTEEEISFMLQSADPIEKLHFSAWLREEIDLDEACRRDTEARAAT